MAIEVGIWRIDEGTDPVKLTGFDIEDRLESAIEKDISILDDQLMVIGRQVRTDYSTKLDLLAIDEDGDLVVIELKRDKTPRDIVAQVLDYASWIQYLTNAEIEVIFSEFQDRYGSDPAPTSLAEALKSRFKGVPGDYNANHRLLIVATTMDPATERIVEYLRETHKVDINVALIHAFVDEERQYVTRAWLRENVRLSGGADDGTPMDVEWNGQHFVNVGEGEYRSWNDARCLGYVSAGGGSRYRDAMQRLHEGDKVWAYISGHGYVGYGEVAAEAVSATEFVVSVDGRELPIDEAELEAKVSFPEDHEEWYVGINWIRKVDRGNAIWEKGMFYALGTAARPRSPKWQETIDTLMKRWRIEEEPTTTPPRAIQASPSDPTSG